jgi:hypothetical protein
MLGQRLRVVITGLALVAALAVPVAGCGGSSQKDDYKKQAEKAANDFKNNAQAASAKVSSATTDQGRFAGLDALKGAVNQAADDFDKLDPPDSAKKYNDDLVTELRTLASDIDQVKQAAQSKDQAKAQQLLIKLQQDQSQIQSTLDQLEKSVK